MPWKVGRDVGVVGWSAERSSIPSDFVGIVRRGAEGRQRRARAQHSFHSCVACERRCIRDSPRHEPSDRRPMRDDLPAEFLLNRLSAGDPRDRPGPPVADPRHRPGYRARPSGPAGAGSPTRCRRRARSGTSPGSGRSGSTSTSASRTAPARRPGAPPPGRPGAAQEVPLLHLRAGDRHRRGDPRRLPPSARPSSR